MQRQYIDELNEIKEFQDKLENNFNELKNELREIKYKKKQECDHYFPNGEKAIEYYFNSKDTGNCKVCGSFMADYLSYDDRFKEDGDYGRD